MKFDRQRTPVISGNHDWVQKISEAAFIFLSNNVFTPTYLVFPEHNDSVQRGITVLHFVVIALIETILRIPTS